MVLSVSRAIYAGSWHVKVNISVSWEDIPVNSVQCSEPRRKCVYSWAAWAQGRGPDPLPGEGKGAPETRSTLGQKHACGGEGSPGEETAAKTIRGCVLFGDHTLVGLDQSVGHRCEGGGDRDWNGRTALGVKGLGSRIHEGPGRWNCFRLSLLSWFISTGI